MLDTDRRFHRQKQHHHRHRRREGIGRSAARQEQSASGFLSRTDGWADPPARTAEQAKPARANYRFHRASRRFGAIAASKPRWKIDGNRASGDGVVCRRHPPKMMEGKTTIASATFAVATTVREDRRITTPKITIFASPSPERKVKEPAHWGARLQPVERHQSFEAGPMISGEPASNNDSLSATVNRRVLPQRDNVASRLHMHTSPANRRKRRPLRQKMGC